MTATDRDVIRLTVPAEDDFVAVLRVAVRVASGRAGRSDDVRSRLTATAGSAFFALLRGAGASGAITTELQVADDRVLLTMTPESANPIEPEQVAGIGDGQEITNGGRTLRVWVGT